VVKDMLELVHAKGQGTGPKEEVGSVLYMRGLISAMLGVEGVRKAQERYGKGKVMTGEQTRWGLENLNLDQKMLDGMGFAGVMRPVQTSCLDHMGSSWVRVHQWDGASGPSRPTGTSPMTRCCAPMVMLASGKYAEEKKLTPRTPEQCKHVMPLAPRREARGLYSGIDDDSRQYLPQRQQRRGHLQPRDPGLKGVSFNVPEGGIVALLGGNGAGKTTTLRAVSNLLHGERGEVTKGSIELKGERVEALTPADLVKRGVIQVMEGRHCFGHLTIEENLLTGAYTRTDGKAAVKAKPGEGLQLLPAPEDAAHQPGRLYLRRRAADVRHRPGADGRPEDGAARRAVDGPGAADRRGGVHHRQGSEPRRR
jgi:hypothetical protein